MIRIKYSSFLVFLYVIAIALFAFRSTASSYDVQAQNIQEGDQLQAAPDFTLQTIDGGEVTLSQYKDKIVVLEWFNYDCPFVKYHYSPTVATMSKLAARYADKDVVWLTINSTYYATIESNKQWAQEHQMPNLLLMDSDGKAGKLYKAETTPHMFIINRQGQIAYQGAIDNAPLGNLPEGQKIINYVDKAISELLEGKQVTIPKTKPYGCTVKYAKQQG